MPERRFIRKDNFDLNLSEEEILTDVDLEKLSADTDIQELLRDPLLHRILIRLDNSRDRRQAFARLCETSPIFNQLIEKVSLCVGFDHSGS